VMCWGWIVMWKGMLRQWGREYDFQDSRYLHWEMSPCFTILGCSVRSNGNPRMNCDESRGRLPSKVWGSATHEVILQSSWRTICMTGCISDLPTELYPDTVKTSNVYPCVPRRTPSRDKSIV
jgi:hypothetical protein